MSTYPVDVGIDVGISSIGFEQGIFGIGSGGVNVVQVIGANGGGTNGGGGVGFLAAIS